MGVGRGSNPRATAEIRSWKHGDEREDGDGNSDKCGYQKSANPTSNQTQIAGANNVKDALEAAAANPANAATIDAVPLVREQRRSFTYLQACIRSLSNSKPVTHPKILQHYHGHVALFVSQ